MTTDLTSPREQDQRVRVNVQGGSPDAVYGLGLIGAWAFYIGRAQNTRERVLGFFKGLVWPAFLVYELLVFLHPVGPTAPAEGDE